MIQGQLFGSLTPSSRAADPVEAVQRHFPGVDFDNLRGISTQSRYRMFQSYQRDKARVDAGGAPKRAVVKSYDALRSNIGEQFSSLASDPAVPKPEFGSYSFDNGYSNVGAMLEDQRKGSFKVNQTAPGEDTVAWDNPTNDKFRAIHDIVGHGGSGGSFSPAGESLATSAHRATMPKETHRALTGEVMGQASSWEFNGNQFIEQKGLYAVPRWAAEGREAPRPPRRTFISRAKQGRLFE